MSLSHSSANWLRRLRRCSGRRGGTFFSWASAETANNADDTYIIFRISFSFQIIYLMLKKINVFKFFLHFYCILTYHWIVHLYSRRNNFEFLLDFVEFITFITISLLDFANFDLFILLNQIFQFRVGFANFELNFEISSRILTISIEFNIFDRFRTVLSRIIK